MKSPIRLFTLSAIALAVLSLHGGAQAQTAAEISAEMKLLREELRQVRSELDAIKRQQATTSASIPATAAASAVTPAPGATPVPVVASAAPPAAESPRSDPEAPSAVGAVSLFGYGELSYSRPRGKASDATATAGRGVLGWAYRFNEKTRMAAELEVENAVVSADDRGEVAFEQLYVEHDLSDKVSAKIGLFLLPVGLLNENHEPTTYYGVFRNPIETAIIPTTWRELGIGFRGNTDAGFRWDAGLVTGFDLTKWDPTSVDGRASPLGSIHQEGQLAKAGSLAGYGALNYLGVPGLKVGGSVYYGGAGQQQTGFAAPNATVTLAEVHARWQPGNWDLQALASTGRFSNVSALNATFAGQSTPVPDSFGGWYATAAYKFWHQGDQSLVAFARYDSLNTARSYSGLAPGLAPELEPDTRVWTLGANYYLTPQVVLKFDIARFLNNHSLDVLNLGVGFNF